MPAGGSSHERASAADFRGGVGGTGGQADPRQGREIREVVADVRAVFERDGKPPGEPLDVAALVAAALDDGAARNGEVAETCRQRRREAPGQDPDDDAGGLRGLDGKTVAGGKELHCLAVGAVVQAGIGEDTVDVENEKSHPRGALSDGVVHAASWRNPTLDHASSRGGARPGRCKLAAMNELAKWESRYLGADEPFYGVEPSPFLSRSMALLPAGGRCLDLAGGEGRNAVFLAARGWDVTLIDGALAGVARAHALAATRGVPVHLVAADLRRFATDVLNNRFDLVLVVNYHDPSLLAAACDWLRPGGALLIEGFAREQLARSSGGPQDLAQLWGPNQVIDALRPLRLVWYEDRLISADDNPRHRGDKWVVRAIARRA